MTYQVQIESENILFSAETHESILEAAIRAGVPINYGCSNGNCGLCKARVVAGETQLFRRHDFVIRDAEKIQGFALMCSISCNSDLIIDATIAKKATDIPVQDLRVKVRKIDRISDELVIITTQLPRTTRLRFIAGQFMRVYDDQERSHEYAIASCPCDDRRVEFHVRKIEQDAFSKLVFENLNIGDWLNIQGPYGDFVIDERDGRPIIMVAFDTGFAAIKSLLEHVTAQDNEREIYLYWLACAGEGLYLNNLCRSWNDAFDQFHYIPLQLSKHVNEVLDGEYEGMTTIEDILTASLYHIEHLTTASVFTVSPEPIAKLVEQLLTQKGFQLKQFHHEEIRGNPNLKCIHPTS